MPLDLQQLLPPLDNSLNVAEERFDVLAEATPAPLFFRSLVKGTGHNLVIHPQVIGTITLQLSNVTLAETLPARAEYWNGSRFAVNTDDSCWGYSAALASPETSGLTTVTGSNGVLLQGQADVVALSAPGAGNTGTVRINYATPVFLQDDFNNTGALENPSGLATFGIFRGHDRVIYWREVGR
ncbi:DUF6701 domain-containing protein [Venatoribacter cucullus]|uniref:DUF6701 domain-containing protein n=1 Tax=Venatoribacter cucullus TaxID=2661630 RepID=UPI00224005B2|nr:DUF6701 domain-containing protein [Venatoribacter cucullus]UZK02769.1 hypothetical protein GAY96_02065 [Venatoribacter cucullus]